MNPDLDDPRLTAFALGELEGEDRASIEALLADSESARRVVAEVRAQSALLNEGLCGEESPALDDGRRAAIFAQASDPAPPLRLHLQYPSERTDIYHVITHPGAEARRYRAQLLAIAAAVAIVAAGLTLLFSSMFLHQKPRGDLVAVNPPAPPPLVIPLMPGTIDPAIDATPGIAARSPRELLANPLGDPEGPEQPFGIAGGISVAPIREAATHPFNGYALTIENPFLEAGRHPLSGFSFDVGHASYATVRRAIEQKRLPGKDDVRLEQLVNYFPYDYASPKDGEAFAARIEVAWCPWRKEHRLVRIGLKARSAPQSQPIANDVRIRVEFNPAQVAAYRLLGYDRRLTTRDAAGDGVAHNHVEAGQAVTALYEVIPAGDEVPHEIEPLKYQRPAELTAAGMTRELLTVKLNYTDPAGPDQSQSFSAVDSGTPGPASEDFQFAAAVAGFGLILRDSPHKGQATYDVVLALALAGQRNDVLGERARFIELVQQARGL